MDSKELEREREKTERLLREARVEIERLELENHSLRQLLFGSYRSMNQFKPENNLPVIEHEEHVAAAEEKVENIKNLPRVHSTPVTTNNHVQSPDEQAVKKVTEIVATIEDDDDFEM